MSLAMKPPELTHFQANHLNLAAADRNVGAWGVLTLSHIHFFAPVTEPIPRTLRHASSPSLTPASAFRSWVTLRGCLTPKPSLEISSDGFPSKSSPPPNAVENHILLCSLETDIIDMQTVFRPLCRLRRAAGAGLPSVFFPSPLMLASRVSLIAADRQRFKLASGCVRTKTAASARTASCGEHEKDKSAAFIVKGSTEEKRLEVQDLSLCAFSI